MQGPFNCTLAAITSTKNNFSSESDIATPKVHLCMSGICVRNSLIRGVHHCFSQYILCSSERQRCINCSGCCGTRHHSCRGLKSRPIIGRCNQVLAAQVCLDLNRPTYNSLSKCPHTFRFLKYPHTTRSINAHTFYNSLSKCPTYNSISECPHTTRSLNARQ